MRYLRHIFSPVIKIYRNYHWQKQEADIERLSFDEKIALRAQLVDLSEKKILIISPHPDDELIGCYEILKLYGSNVDVYYTGLTGRELSEENKRIRTEEFVRLCSACCANCILPSENWKIDLKKYISENDYDCLFIPSYIDWHWEHREVCVEALSLIQGLQKEMDIYLYCVTVPIPIQFVNSYAEKTENKWSLFNKIYKSQRYMPISRFRITEKRYVTDGKKFEPYYNLSIESLAGVLGAFRSLDTNRLDSMEKQINDLQLILDSSFRFYKKLESANLE